MNFHFTLRTRIYLSMLAMILISFLVTGGLTIYDHYEKTESHHLQVLKENETHIRNSLEYVLDENEGRIPTDSIPYIFGERICELSSVHEMYIAMFDLKGHYLISSNSSHLDSLGVPNNLNYSILKQLSTGSSQTVMDVSPTIANMTLAYWYFMDNQKRPIAITMVAHPRVELDKSALWLFLRELLQTYVVLFLLAALVAYFLSTYITRSLQLISKRLQGVELGVQNEPIIWKSDDEIGALVKVYNRMLTELDSSADLLARQERESAWREMAKQVAHEIKNPLTPMKLRVQHLERSWKDGSEGFEKKLAVFTTSMTEQIETLTNIANEFSNFAKMPKPNLTEVDLKSVLFNTVELYKDNDLIKMDARVIGNGAFVVSADKDHTVRILNNLITNAIQAMPVGSKGKVDISLRNYRNYSIIRVCDNGPGIPEDSKARIFVPNFTTKSTGTGLGLAMVKNMMEQCGGSVWFWSREGKGASFYLSFIKR